ncbi:transcriptional regulator family: Fungal Specific TF [Trichoderma harzianum]|nr:transcriptional regulator family: Fungal Specific TF [Trichoderma harzianum]
MGSSQQQRSGATAAQNEIAPMASIECRNCLRLGVGCPGFSPQSEFISRKEMQKSADDIFKAAGVEKRRVGSCEECRSSKHRCTKTRPSCRRCILRHLPCVYPSKPDKQQERESSTQPASSVASSTAAAAGLTSTVSAQPLEPGQWANPALLHAFGVNIESLCTDTLPKDHGLRLRLINAFFDRSHHLRCLTFVHQPSFMQSLESASIAQDYGEPLLYAMCALGARHIYFDATFTLDGPDRDLLPSVIPGQAWAERARKEILGEMHAPTVQNLMTVALLCEYGLREDQHALVFILLAFLHRAIRLLSLDSPRPLPNHPTTAQMMQREIENRIVWASFVIDSLAANGVEKNMCWKDHIPSIPLPCSDDCFNTSQLSVPRHYLLQIEDSGMQTAISELDLSALLVVVVRLRTKVMQLIRVADPGMRIWEPSSQFVTIIDQLIALYNNMPERYYLTDANLYVLKDKGMLGGVFALHLFIHAVIFDLTRISLAGFSFPLAPAFKNSPVEFRAHCQSLCRFHASQVSDIIRTGLSFNRGAFDDLFCPDATIESTKVQIIFAATVDQSPQTLQVTRDNIISNLNFLLTIHNRGKEAPTQFIRGIIPLCHLFGFRDIAERYQETLGLSIPIDPAEVTGSADDHHLVALASFRRGRVQLQESQATGSAKTMSSGNDNKSPLIHASQSVIYEETVDRGNGGDFTSSLPILRPTYPPIEVAPELLSQSLAQRNPLQIMPSAGVMVQNGAILQPSVDDYIKTADEMSTYLTWGMTEIPHWMNLPDPMPPG